MVWGFGFKVQGLQTPESSTTTMPQAIVVTVATLLHSMTLKIGRPPSGAGCRETNSYRRLWNAIGGIALNACSDRVPQHRAHARHGILAIRVGKTAILLHLRLFDEHGCRPAAMLSTQSYTFQCHTGAQLPKTLNLCRTISIPFKVIPEF